MNIAADYLEGAALNGLAVLIMGSIRVVQTTAEGSPRRSVGRRRIVTRAVPGLALTWPVTFPLIFWWAVMVATGHHRELDAAADYVTPARPPVIEPIDESDPFCTCPKCGLLGTHDLKVEQATRELVVLSDDHAGNRTAMWKHPYGFGVPDGSWLVARQCWSCAHEWKTLLDQPKGTGA